MGVWGPGGWASWTQVGLCGTGGMYQMCEVRKEGSRTPRRFLVAAATNEGGAGAGVHGHFRPWRFELLGRRRAMTGPREPAWGTPPWGTDVRTPENQGAQDHHVGNRGLGSWEGMPVAGEQG